MVASYLVLVGKLFIVPFTSKGASHMPFLFAKDELLPEVYPHDNILAEMLLSNDEHLVKRAFNLFSFKYIEYLHEQDFLLVLDEEYYNKALWGVLAVLHEIAIDYPNHQTDGWVLLELIDVLRNIVNAFSQLQQGV
jgi:hypothetical protein